MASHVSAMRPWNWYCRHQRATQSVSAS